MVSKTEKQRAMRFIAELLEHSENYAIESTSDKEVQVQEKHADDNKRIKVVLANALSDINAFNDFYATNHQKGIYTAPVLYKDGKTAFVRMVDRNSSWRTEKSLKHYSRQKINQMLHLRGIEKAVMEHFGDELTYYQPETTNLEESLRLFNLAVVQLDYSHIGRDHQAYGFVQDRESIDYKLPQETERIKGAAIITFTGQQPDPYCRAGRSGLKSSFSSVR